MSRNPAFNDRVFAYTTPTPAQEWEQAQTVTPVPGVTGPIVDTGRTMSYGGVSAASLILFAIVVATSMWGWTLVTEGTPFTNTAGETITPVDITQPVVFWVALLGGLAVAIVTIWKPHLARFTALLYAALQGVVIGIISHLYNAQFDGIVIQAVAATFSVFLIMLVLYGLRVLRATRKFTKGVIAATGGILLMYLVGFGISLFTGAAPFWADAGPVGIAISVFVVIVAALNLILDFDFIEKGVQRQLPRHMDWYAAFGLAVTIIWLYIEMLRLIGKLRR